VASWFTVRYAVKEANRQTPVLTNRNWIRGPDLSFVRFCETKSTKTIIGIDSAGIGGRKVLLPGEVSTPDFGC